jgi:hypothetical protein
LDAIYFFRNVISDDRRISIGPNLCGKSTFEKEVLVSLYGTTVGVMFINVDRISTCPFTSSHCSSNESPSKGFEKRWKRLTFPNFLQNVVCIISYASGSLVGELMYLLLSKIRINSFSSAKAIFSRCPSEDIIAIRADYRSGFNSVHSLGTEGGGEKVVVPSMGALNPEIRNFCRQRYIDNMHDKVFMDMIPNGTLRFRPDGGIAIMKLVDGVGGEVMFDLHDRRPIDRSGAPIRSIPEGIKRVIFGLKDSREEWIFVGGNVPSRVNDKTFIDQLHVPDAKSTLFCRFADMIPRAISYGIGMLLFLHACPPKSPNNRVNFLNKSFGEKNSGHIIYRNRRKHRLNVLKPSCMIKFVSLKGPKFSKELVKNKIVSSVFIPMAKNHGMA